MLTAGGGEFSTRRVEKGRQPFLQDMGSTKKCWCLHPRRYLNAPHLLVLPNMVTQVATPIDGKYPDVNEEAESGRTRG